MKHNDLQRTLNKHYILFGLNESNFLIDLAHNKF